MSRKKIYSVELKHNAVLKYLESNYSYRDVADEFFCNKCDVIKWVAAYREHGVAGLCTTNGTYTGDFKVAVVEYIKNTGASIRQTAAHFNIPSGPSISKWIQLYDEQGKEALYEERRGRARKLGTKRPRKRKTDINTNEELLAEIQRLRMENEYLKKLNALVQEREKSEKPTK